jgi:uncharacterized membrane protein YraQ (UPF0718 family)
MSALEVIWHGLRDSLLMAWEVWWALVLGFAISAIVQAWVPRARVESALAGSGPRPVALASGLGAASSSCSYAAIAIARSLFAKGASSATALAFQFASTNLVWELGLVLWVLIGWQFTLAEYLGGIVMIALMSLLLRAFVPERLEAQARRRAQGAEGESHCHHAEGRDHPVGGRADTAEGQTHFVGGRTDTAEGQTHFVGGRTQTLESQTDTAEGQDHPVGSQIHAAEGQTHFVGGRTQTLESQTDAAGGENDRDWRERLTSRAAWGQVAHNFRMDWRMLYREIAAGFLLAGFIAQLGDGFFESLFIHDAPAPWPAIESAFVGPLIAVLSFVCSIGNVPLAAVLWSGGIGFAGVLAFLFADLIVLPIIAIYRKYYGSAYALRTVALMYCTMVLAALAVAALFSALGLVPTGPRPTRANIFGEVALDYKLVLNLLGALVFITLFRLGAGRAARGEGGPAIAEVA